MSCTAEHPCGTRIPIYPVRYTVKERSQGAPSSSYNNFNLTKYPYELKHSQYTLRSLREGFVYIYDTFKKGTMYLWRVNDNGTFTELLTKSVTLEGALNSYKTGETHFYINAKLNENSKIFIGFSDVLWTNKKYAEIEMDIKSGSRKISDKLMTEIDILKWTENKKGLGSFSVADIGKFVEEYKDINWKNNLSWSHRSSNLMTKGSKDLKNKMALTSKTIQVVAALHDNIGMVEDQKMLIYKAREAIKKHADKNYRGKIISGFIDDIYTLEYAKEEGITDAGKIDDEINKAIEKKRKSVIETSVRAEKIMRDKKKYSGHIARNNNKLLKKYDYNKNNLNTEYDYRSEVLSNIATLKSRNIN